MKYVDNASQLSSSVISKKKSWLDDLVSFLFLKIHGAGPVQQRGHGYRSGFDTGATYHVKRVKMFIVSCDQN